MKNILTSEDFTLYFLRPEVKAPTRIAEEKQVKPGRQKKGKTYDPQGSQQKHVTFSETEKENGMITFLFFVKIVW